MKRIIKYMIIIILISIVTLLLINNYIILTTKTKIKNLNELKESNVDCIVVLGAGIRGDSPSPMLEDRLLTSIDLYRENISKKIIVSGDHGRINYDEVNVMKNYLIDKEIQSKDIFMDHAGFSTYDSIYRTKEIFKTKKIIIVTQKYHLYRALYIADKLGIEAYGVDAEIREYQFQIARDIREFLARIKDFIKCIFKPKPKYLGETISVIDGNGDKTNDK